LTYRYINLGPAATGPTNSFDGVTVVNQPGFNFGTLTSQDVMLGFPLEPADRVADGPGHHQGLTGPCQGALRTAREKSRAVFVFWVA